MTQDETKPMDPGSEPPEAPAKHIGPYRILDVLGEGGMGTVYLAEQKEPVRRRVAVKVIKLGMDSKEVLDRFEAERQALAMMSHDIIAKVFEAGTTERGQPYFVMEHVPGLPLTEYCDKHRLSTKARLRLFQEICAGVQHAHQKGVIHRDLKPSNILVTEHQGRAIPKIIDFGVAKATDHRLTQATIYTEQGQIIGTPEYMSPEQAEMTSADIDTRTDVYSLGVILYELLVGELPFPSSELRRAGLLEIQRKIREDDPPKPSTRISTLGTDSEHIAKRRKTTLSALVRDLRRDLDWIVMMAMDKDRNRRYGTASALAEDIGRQIGHESVVACPPSLGYSVGRFVRRNRGKVVAAAAVLVTLLCGMASTTYFMFAESAQAAAAIAERDRANHGFALGLSNASAEATDPMLSLLLAREAVKTKQLPETISQLYNALANLTVIGVLRGHLDEVVWAQYSPDGRRILTVSKDGNARLWTSEGTEPRVLAEHKDAILCAAFASDGVFATGSSDHTVRIWSAEGEDLGTLQGHSGSIRSLVFSPDGGQMVLTASEDGTARLWSRDGGEGRVLARYDDAVVAAAFSPNGDRILTVGEAGTAQLLDLQGNRIAQHGSVSRIVESACFSPDGSHLLLGVSEKDVREFHIEVHDVGATSGSEPLDLLPGHTDGITGLTVRSTEGSYEILSVSRDNTARLWIPGTGQSRVFHGHGSSVSMARFSPDGDYILTASWDTTARVFARDGTPVAVLPGHSAAVQTAHFSPTGDDRILTASADRTARLWSLSLEDMPILRGHAGPVYSARVSPSGDRILTASGDETAVLWDTRGERLLKLDHSDVVLTGSFSPDGQSVATTTLDGRVLLWDIHGNQVGPSIRRDSTVFTAFFSPSGKHVLTAQGSAAQIWDISDRQSPTVLHELEGHRAPVVYAAYSRNEEEEAAIVTASEDNTARLWTSDGKPLDVSFPHEAKVWSAEFSPDGQQILTACGDNSAYLWSLGGEELTTFAGHRAEVFLAMFSPEGDRVLTSSRDNTARMWDLEGAELAVLRAHTGPVWAASFSPDSRFIVSASHDGTVRLWPAGTDGLLELVEKHAVRDLSPEEQRIYGPLLGGSTGR